MLKIEFGDGCLSLARTFEWYKRFKEGRTSVDDDPRSGRPLASRNYDSVTRAREIIRVNRRSTVREISAEVGMSYGTCQAILREDLNMRRVSAKFVPHVVTIEHKEHRMSVVNNPLQEAETDQNFMEGIIRGDGAWVYGYEPATKRQSWQWKAPESPRLKKARSKMKVMLIGFFLHGRDCSL